MRLFIFKLCNAPGWKVFMKGDKVEYEVESGRDGKESATNLKLLD